jgi:Pyridoxamine 5'-phosphate oxidase
MTWGGLAADAPELAARGRALLEGPGVAMLGTIRADGSPRISPVEPFFVEAHLVLGVMARSAKARDLERDARCVLHSVIVAPDRGDPELKLTARAVEAPEAVRRAPAGAWWTTRPPELARVVSLSLVEAVLVTWNLEGGTMTVTRWTPEEGTRERSAAYP